MSTRDPKLRLTCLLVPVVDLPGLFLDDLCPGVCPFGNAVLIAGICQSRVPGSFSLLLWRVSCFVRRRAVFETPLTVQIHSCTYERLSVSIDCVRLKLASNALQHPIVDADVIHNAPCY